MKPLPRLQDMPSLVKCRIATRLGYFDKMTLKTACPDFHPIIGNPHCLGSLGLTLGSGSIAIELHDPEIHITRYERRANGCQVIINEDREMFLEGKDYMDLAMRDVEMLVTRNPNFSLESFDVLVEEPSSEFLKKFQETLKSRSLKITHFSMTYSGDQSEVLQLLPYLDSESLEALSLKKLWSSEQDVQLDEIIELDQWKKVKSLTISGFPDEKLPVELFWNFPKTKIRFNEGKLEDLKRVFQHCRELLDFESCEIRTTLEDRQVMEALGGEFGRVDGFQYAYFQKTRAHGIHVYLMNGEVEFRRRAHGWREGFDTDYNEMYGEI